jgi:hypothetical protein
MNINASRATQKFGRKSLIDPPDKIRSSYKLLLITSDIVYHDSTGNDTYSYARIPHKKPTMAHGASEGPSEDGGSRKEPRLQCANFLLKRARPGRPKKRGNSANDKIQAQPAISNNKKKKRGPVPLLPHLHRPNLLLTLGVLPS